MSGLSPEWIYDPPGHFAMGFMIRIETPHLNVDDGLRKVARDVELVNHNNGAETPL
ncbi:MAG: hypothetical protein WBE37_11985 [Bryobacteraceae bacterium]